jgi:hypothetical protein
MLDRNFAPTIEALEASFLNEFVRLQKKFAPTPFFIRLRFTKFVPMLQFAPMQQFAPTHARMLEF